MKLIGAHSGSFHADDVFAVAALSLLHEDYKIVRSRDPKVWETCDFLVDVGGIYDHSQNKYDHHFRNGPTYDDGLPMSSIGLVWKHYGLEICDSKEIADRVCSLLIRGLDANDNGVTLSIPNKKGPEAQEISLSKTIAIMNPQDSSLADAAFEQEVLRAKLLLNAIIADSEQWINSKNEVKASLRYSLSNNLPYIEVGEGCKWQGHLLNSQGNASILYSLYPHGEKWYIRAVPSSIGKFSNRKNLPKNWGGLNDDEFSKAAGIPDGIFCHHSLFICAAHSKESAIKLINKAIAAK